MARDDWGATTFFVWLLRGLGLIFLCIAGWGVLSGDPQDCRAAVFAAMVSFLFSESQGIAVRRRRAEFREADREYVKALQEAVDP
jgi:hypothetical protein